MGFHWNLLSEIPSASSIVLSHCDSAVLCSPGFRVQLEIITEGLRGEIMCKHRWVLGCWVLRVKINFNFHHINRTFKSVFTRLWSLSKANTLTATDYLYV